MVCSSSRNMRRHQQKYDEQFKKRNCDLLTLLKTLIPVTMIFGENGCCFFGVVLISGMVVFKMSFQ